MNWPALIVLSATLTFERAVELATQKAATAPPPALSLTRARLPNVRLEFAGNASRTLDLFSEGPFEVRYATSVVALDYPLWDGGALNARIDAAQLRMQPPRAGLDDARFAQLVDAFAALALVQRQQEVLRPQVEHMTAEADRTAQLLASGEITNLTAADRRDAALNFTAQSLELEARRIEAVARLRLLTGVEDLSGVDSSRRPGAAASTQNLSVAIRDDAIVAATIAFETSRARLREITASTGFRALLSGFAGVGSAQSAFRDATSEGSFGVYGLRVNVAYPLFRGAGELSIAEARADLERARIARDAAVDAARARQAELQLRDATARQRIEILQRSVEASKEREESLRRLIAAGIRSESELAQAMTDRSRREGELAAAEVERWKIAQLLARMSGQP
jgi:outer membrane protein, adhesin transport system